MIEALHAGGDAAPAVEAKSALARVDGLSQMAGSEEIELADIAGIKGATVTRQRWAASEARAAENFAGQEYLHDVAGFAASKQAQRAAYQKAANRGARGTFGNANTASEPSD